MAAFTISMLNNPLSLWGDLCPGVKLHMALDANILSWEIAGIEDSRTEERMTWRCQPISEPIRATNAIVRYVSACGGAATIVVVKADPNTPPWMEGPLDSVYVEHAPTWREHVCFLPEGNE